MKNTSFLMEEFGAVLFPVVLISLVILFLLAFGNKETRRRVTTFLIVAGVIAAETTRRLGKMSSLEEAIAGTFAVGGTFLVIALPIAVVFWVATRPREG